MIISIYDNSLPSPRTAASPIKETRSYLLRKSSTTISSMQVHRSWADALLNDMRITAYCAISSYIYGLILVLNLHSMWAAHWRNTRFLFWYLTYCTHFSTCLCSSWLLSLAPLFIFCFIRKFVALVYHICYFRMYCYQYRFYFETDSTVLFHSMVLVRLQLFLCLF